MSLLPRKERSPNLSDPAMQKTFIQDTTSGKALLQKELSINAAEQQLLKKRIELVEKLLNDIPSSDPHYSMLMNTLKMDQIEIDELSYRATLLVQKISETP